MAGACGSHLRIDIKTSIRTWSVVLVFQYQMGTKLPVACESFEMATCPSRTFGMRELGEVTVPTTEANSVLAAVLWMGVDVVLQLLPRGKDYSAVVAFGGSCFRRCYLGDVPSFDVSDSSHLDLNSVLRI